MILIIFLVSMTASLMGAISGIGGGVIIKPVLDTLGLYPLPVINFLSSCSVLSMTMVTLWRNRNSGIVLEKRTSTTLAVGGVLGGYAGKALFDLLKHSSNSIAALGAIQYALLMLMTIAVLVFTLNKARFKTTVIRSLPLIALTGLALGALASFLGIGGGPINLAVLYLLFSMDAKKGALNSIYIIFFSQITNIGSSLLSGTVPEFEPLALAVMVAGGISGGLAGSRISKKLSLRGVDKLFCTVMGVIILISMWNFTRFAFL